MIVVALSLLAGLALLVGVGAPAAADEFRAGRAAFVELTVRRAAEGELAGWFQGQWTAAALALLPGEAQSFPSESVHVRTLVERRLLRVSPTVWMLEVRAVQRDLAARDLAASSRALLVGLRQEAGDSVLTPYPIARPWVQAHQ